MATPGQDGRSGAEVPDDAAPGWDAIAARLAALYPGQEPRHWAPALPAVLGGRDPLDGISVYRSEDPVPHWHFVTFGLSELYRKAWEDPAVSGFGLELTFRLTRAPGEERPPGWPIHLLQNLARYVFSSGNVLQVGDHLDANGRIALDEETALVALAVAADSPLAPIDGPNGRLDFRQLVAVTADEYAAIRAWSSGGLLAVLARAHPGHVTDLRRASILADPAVRAEVEAGTARDGSTTGLLFNDATAWRVEQGWLRGERVTVQLGAAPARDVAQILPGRLPHGRPFSLLSQAQRVDLEPAGAAGWRAEGGALHLALTRAQALELGRRLSLGAGAFDLAGLGGVRFEVVPTVVRDQDGKPVRTIE